MIKLCIPATSANIGSGFDSLGLALDMYNYVYLEECDRVSITALDGADIPTGDDNLVYKTIKHLYNLCGKTLHGVEIWQQSHIPFSRGLGSSSACIIGGLVGANEMMGRPLTRDEIIDLAATMEGHPDNSTPALTGGLVTAVLEAGRVHYVKQEVGAGLKFAAIIPDFELSTATAREALPDTLPHADARFNLSRAALMAVSLYAGKYENLRVAADDRLHQPYRLKLIPHAAEVMAICGDNGAYAAYISGAGPTIIAIIGEIAPDFERKTRKSLDTMGLNTWQIHILSIDNDGTQVEIGSQHT